VEMKFQLPPPLPEKRARPLRQSVNPAHGESQKRSSDTDDDAAPTGRENASSLSIPAIQASAGSSKIATGISPQKPKQLSTKQFVNAGVAIVIALVVFSIVLGNYWNQSAKSPAGAKNVPVPNNTELSTPAYLANSSPSATASISLIAPLPSLKGTVPPSLKAQLPSPYATPTPSNSATVMPASLVFHVVNVLTGDQLNVHAGPGDSYQVIGYLPPETDGVTITGTSVKNGTTSWAPVVVGQVKGWVNREYLAPSGSKTGAFDSASQSPSSLIGERFPQTRLRLLSAADLKGMSVAELRYAINEVYARYGAAFTNNPDVRRQFQKFDWYQPNTDITFSDIDQSMSEIERENIKLLGQYGDARRSK
jgi:hypothetical protein